MVRCARNHGNAVRKAAGKATTDVDLARDLGEVLYGAVDRLDFTVIGPAVNEVSRIELRCEPLGRHTLRGVREPREIYALASGSCGPSR